VNPACFSQRFVISIRIPLVHAAKLWQNTEHIHPQRLRVCAGILGGYEQGIQIAKISSKFRTKTSLHQRSHGWDQCAGLGFPFALAGFTMAAWHLHNLFIVVRPSPLFWEVGGVLFMSTKVLINGELFDKEDAKISVYDHGLLYGDGVFEGMRSYNGKIFQLEKHLDRLWESAKAICIEIPGTKEEMATACIETLRASDLLENGYIRLIITRGVGSLGISPDSAKAPQVIIIADHIALYPKELYECGLKIITASTMRNHPAALSPRIKSLNYLNNILAKIEGIRAGCAEAIMLNHKGEVSECTGDNLFLVKNGELFTPPLDACILGGITRDTILDLARDAGMKTHETSLTRHDVFVADECFLTGSAAEVVPVIEVDYRPIGTGTPGPITRDLQHRFHEHVRA